LPFRTVSSCRRQGLKSLINLDKSTTPSPWRLSVAPMMDGLDLLEK
jgi:hypothetical protein